MQQICNKQFGNYCHHLKKTLCGYDNSKFFITFAPL